MSTLFWAVFDEEQKKLTEDMLVEFEKEARDELGMTAIMTKIADKLFPGSSVTHTRLRYMFFVGKILHSHLKSGYKLDSLENSIRDALKSNYENDTSKKGIFGVSFEGDMTVKQPSYKAYFSLLKKWHIIEDAQISSLDLDSLDRGFKKIIEKNNYSNSFSFELEENEKEYIKDTLDKYYGDSFFYKLFIDETIDLSGDFIDIEINNYTDGQKELIRNAQNFSILMWGSALYYNHFLGIDVDEKFKEWITLLPRLDDWNLEYIKELFLNEDKGSTDFIEKWFDITHSNTLDITNNKQIKKLNIRELIKKREYALRHKKARLSNQLDDKPQNKPHGIHMLNYRWNHIQTFIDDFRSTK